MDPGPFMFYQDHPFMSGHKWSRGAIYVVIKWSRGPIKYIDIIWSLQNYSILTYVPFEFLIV